MKNRKPLEECVKIAHEEYCDIRSELVTIEDTGQAYFNIANLGQRILDDLNYLATGEDDGRFFDYDDNTPRIQKYFEGEGE